MPRRASRHRRGHRAARASGDSARSGRTRARRRFPRAYLDAVVARGRATGRRRPVRRSRAAARSRRRGRADAAAPTSIRRCTARNGTPRCTASIAPPTNPKLALVRAAIERQTPTLAICRGLQVLNVALGGTLHQHIPELPGVERHGRPGEAGGAWLHDIDVTPESLLASVFGTTRVAGSCHHHQRSTSSATGLRVTAASRRRHRRRARARRHVAARRAVASRRHRRPRSRPAAPLRRASRTRARD